MSRLAHQKPEYGVTLSQRTRYRVHEEKGNLEICEQRLAVPFVNWTNLKDVVQVEALARRFASSSSIVNIQHP
jgi:hypothetical protein